MKLIKQLIDYENETYGFFFNKEVLQDLYKASKKVVAGERGELEKLMAQLIIQSVKDSNIEKGENEQC